MSITLAPLALAKTISHITSSQLAPSPSLRVELRHFADPATVLLGQKVLVVQSAPGDARALSQFQGMEQLGSFKLV